MIVGDLVGEGPARGESVVRETRNLAARLQQAASPGAVVISDHTRRLLGGAFDLRDLGAVELKGFGESLKAFQVLCERSSMSRF